MRFAIKWIIPIFVLTLAVPAAYAAHHEGGHGAKAASETPKGEGAGKDCPYSKSDSACGTGKCPKCAACDAGECTGENCAENGCGDCAATKTECEKCAEGKGDGCCKAGGECDAAKNSEGGCPHCGKNN